MGSKSQASNHLFSFILIALGAMAVGISALNFSVTTVDASFVVFALFMTALSAALHQSTERAKFQPVVSLIVVFLAFLEYGAATAVVFALVDGIFTSLNFRLQKEAVGAKTVALKTSVVTLSAFGATMATNALLTTPEIFGAAQAEVAIVATLASVAFAHFVVSILFITALAALRDPKQVSSVLGSFVANNILGYFGAALLAGGIAFGMSRFANLPVVLAGVALVLVFLAYKGSPEKVEDDAAGVEEGRPAVSDDAEQKIVELQRFIAEQEQVNSALKESKEKFRHAAFHDTLTDLPNRNLFIESLRFQIEKAKTSNDYRFAVLFLDLDRFKMINDSLGHSLGDRLIWHVARRLSKLANENDLVARFSGDEFAILISGHNNPSDLMNIAQLVKHKLSAPFSLNGRQVFTSVSIGMAIGSPVYGEADEMLRDADIAMYYAKEHGNGVEIFDSAMHTKAVKLLQLETDLRHAAERNELVAYYQPIVDLATMRLTGFESLVRWNHPHRGLIPPLDFIPMAEETGMIIPLTMWMLRESCTQLAKWQERSPLNKTLMMSINLSGKHFSDPNIVESVRSILLETGVSAPSLKLEITESAVMENADVAIEVLKQLRDIGCQLSIDDFGTGYSSLSYLHKFPIDMLKVDRSFVSTMEDGTENGEIVRTIISLAKTLGLSVVAEGIESIHQLHQLRILGCEYGQGFLFARPVPSEEATALLDDRARWQNIIPDNNPAVVAQNREFSQLRMMK